MKKTIAAIVLCAVFFFGCSELKKTIDLGERVLLEKHQIYGSGKMVFVFEDGLVITDSAKRLAPGLVVGKKYHIFRDNVAPFYYRVEVVN